MSDLFSDYSKAKVYYCPGAERLFIFHASTFFELPTLEREDGLKLILPDPKYVRELCGLPMEARYKLVYIGEL